MITILYPYRDRELSRIKRSLDSLSEQSNKNFNVLFVDYGSEPELSKSVKELLSSYDFVKHIYSYHCNQPWSRAKAINIGLKQVETEYVFVSDIDMIFKRNFIEIVQQLKDPMVSVYFKVGFLSQLESKKNQTFEDYEISFFSKPSAQGLSLFPVEALKKVRGFDEFFHFWGAEDEDVHHRLAQAGYQISFYEEEILMLHRWHRTFRSLERDTLTKELQIKAISKLNEQYFFKNRDKKLVVVNSEIWGKSISKETYETLMNVRINSVILNNKEYIHHFLFIELPRLKDGIISVEFRASPNNNGLKYFLKKKMGKSVPSCYNLKEINDLLLLHLVSFYSNSIYSYTISDDLDSIQLRLKK